MGLRLFSSRRLGTHWLRFLLALGLILHGPTGWATEPDPILLRFEVFGGPGLHFLTLRATVRQSSDDYSLAAEAETRFLADLFVDLRSKLEVRGRISAGRYLPQALRVETHRRGADFHTRIDYRTDGAVVAEATPPPTREVTPVSPAQMRGTVDQLTAYLVLAHRLSQTGSCALALAIFDGRRRYDLIFSDLPPETIPRLAAPIQVCGMSRRRIAGFPADVAGSETSDQGKLWFARLLRGDLMVPVRMSFEGEFGTFRADLRELRGRGVDLRLAE
jgi:Protein of unknown function (DUF3108)